MEKSIKFLIMMLIELLARVKLHSTRENPVHPFFKFTVLTGVL